MTWEPFVYTNNKAKPEPEPVSDDPRDLRWSWVEIDRKAIDHNVRQFKQLVGPRVRLLAVVKADGYGHGAVECARIALTAGASWLAVATAYEGIELREAGITDPILILSEPPISAIPAVLEHDLIPALYTVDFAVELGEQAARRGKVADYHLAINTGMNRIGVWYNEVADFLRMISFHSGIKLQGTFTHFATADEADERAFRLQLRRFNEALELIKFAGENPGIVHCANSAAAMRYREAHFDMVRLGISMYGLAPSPYLRGKMDLRPAMSVHARITAVNNVPMGEGVSYGLHYQSPGNVRICTIPIGYADGLSRQLSGHMKVIHNCRAYQQVGNICMDQCMFEIDCRPSRGGVVEEPEVGQEVIVIGSQGEFNARLDDMADALGTINYELACRFGMRMPRVYV
ncbi:MAG: alanine racemase [Coriobacteriales bacterium]|jgi:alanine racemase